MNRVVVSDVHVMPSAERQRNVQFSFLALFFVSRVNKLLLVSSFV